MYVNGRLTIEHPGNRKRTLSKEFWGAFWETLTTAGFYPWEIRQQARSIELLRTIGVYSSE